jgi:nucleotidyltransferase/DNA polymerase involved in DNA repair
MLFARLATKKAKPNGVFSLLDHSASYLEPLPVDELPTLGYSTASMLNSHCIFTCGDLVSKGVLWLQNHFGKSKGLSLFELASGIDHRSIGEKALDLSQRTMGADIGWGVRFKSVDQMTVSIILYLGVCVSFVKSSFGSIEFTFFAFFCFDFFCEIFKNWCST